MTIQKIKSTTTWEEGAKVNIKSGNTSFSIGKIDPEDPNEEGILPGEIFLGSLGSWKGMTLVMLAKKFRVELKDFKVDIDGYNNPDRDIEKGLTDIRTKYTIKSDSDKNQIKRLINAVESNCPVHETIINPLEFETEIEIE